MKREAYSFRKWRCLKCLTLLLLLGVGINASAQEGEGKLSSVVVKLNKGGIITGYLVKFEPGHALWVKTERGDTMRIDDMWVRKIQYLDSNKRFQKSRHIYAFKERGVYHASSVGLTPSTAAIEDGGLTGVSLSTVFGYQHNRWLGTGIGSGIEFYHVDRGEMVVPIFGEIRGYFLKDWSTPYFTIRGGYGLAIKNEEADIFDAGGGWMFNPSFGWRLSGKKGMNLFMDLGVQFQEASYEFRSGSERSNVEIFYKRLNVRMGFLF